MVSTYVSYLTVARDMNASLSAIASKATVASDTQYYKDNINKVTTVDEFMGDYRLYSYAMKAYGLEDMTYAKAFMKKVLESDLSDSSSFANKLSDSRYADFAAAFKFSGETIEAQSTAQETNLLDAYQASFDDEQDNISAETSYYQGAISDVTSVDDLLGNTRLKNYVLTSFGLSTDYTSTSFLRDVLTSDLSDPASFANQLGDATYLDLAKAFNFNTDGSVKAGGVQSDDQASLVTNGYTVASATFASSTTGSAYSTYFSAEIANVSSVDDLMQNAKLVSYIRTAYGISEDDPDNYISAALKNADVADAIGLGDLHDAFNFNEDGSLSDVSAQTADQTAATSASFATNYQSAIANFSTDDAIANYKTRMASVTSINDFLTSNTADDDSTNDEEPELWEMALRSFGIDPASVSKSELRSILSSDPDDPKSYVNGLKDDRFVAFREAFNFDKDGKASVPLQAMSESVIDDFAAAYKQNKIRYLTGTAQTDAGKAADTEATYFREQMGSIKTVSDLLSNDRLVNFVLEAKGIDPKDVKAADLKKMFASDLDDKKSFVNQQSDNRFAEIVASFNFDSDGNISKDPTGSVQQRGDVLQTVNDYLQQTLESDEGDENTGVRLALYFQRKAPTISNAYDILGDSALMEFFTTTFNLSSYVSSMDVDKQADMVNQYIDLKDLSDPDKVESLIKRFTAMYDVKNGTQGTSPALSILSNSSSGGISADTLLAVAQLKTA